MLVALLVMASGLVVAGVTAPSAPGAHVTGTVSSVTDRWTSPAGAHQYSSRSRSSGPLLLLLQAEQDQQGDEDFLATANDAGYHVLSPADWRTDGLRRTLARLAQGDPTGGWERYLDGRAVRWSEVVLAGTGKGATSAARIAGAHRVRGVLLLGEAAHAVADEDRLSHTPVRSVRDGWSSEGWTGPAPVAAWRDALDQFV
jgi:hypothetical protein